MMGHERTGTLPKTQRWREVVQQLAGLYLPAASVPVVARSTVENVRARFGRIHRDAGVLATFRFLTEFAVGCRSANPSKELRNLGVTPGDSLTPLVLAKALRESVAAHATSLEYGEIAQSAAIDALVLWYRDNASIQHRLFEVGSDPVRVWRRAATPGGFCELARLFFAKFTERYLNYFLEREASAVIEGIDRRDRFRAELREYVDRSSRHAFETARITQSYAAGWFAKHAATGVPADRVIERFLAHALGKIREELRRESDE